jgi:hypothetical protein
MDGKLKVARLTYIIYNALWRSERNVQCVNCKCRAATVTGSYGDNIHMSVDFQKGTSTRVSIDLEHPELEVRPAPPKY